MRVLIALGESYFPQECGGAQTSTRELANAFKSVGVDAGIAANLARRSVRGVAATARMAVSGRGFVRDRHEGAVVYRAPRPAAQIGAIMDDFRPDAVLVQAMSAMPVAHAVSRLGVPLVVYWRDAELQRMNGSPKGLKAHYIANSDFTARFYDKYFGVKSVVIPPLIERKRYEASHFTRQSVTFIGLMPEKGVEVAIGVAEACPEIQFEFVESWILSRARKRVLLGRLAALPNVRFTPHQSNMLGVYGRTRLLLAPSQWQEAWGRVASEAHINAIPVVGSRIGGLPEAIGPGGVLLDPGAPVSDWAASVRALWHGQTALRALSERALAYSQRPELDPRRALEQIIAVTRAAIEAHRVPRPAAQSDRGVARSLALSAQ